MYIKIEINGHGTAEQVGHRLLDLARALIESDNFQEVESVIESRELNTDGVLNINIKEE